MRTTVTIPEPILENAKKRAAERGVTLSEVVVDALRKDLAEKPQKHPRRFQLHTVKGRLVRPDLDLDRTSAILMMDEEDQFRGNR